MLISGQIKIDTAVVVRVIAVKKRWVTLSIEISGDRDGPMEHTVKPGQDVTVALNLDMELPKVTPIQRAGVLA